jgi:hypothetical protein
MRVSDENVRPGIFRRINKFGFDYSVKGPEQLLIPAYVPVLQSPFKPPQEQHKPQ